MAAIRAKDTKPELIIRKMLHKAGFRYRLHDKSLPGKPDLFFPKYNAVIFVHGCFWHGHNCHFFKAPATRTDFWLGKIKRNQENDLRVANRLREKGLRVLNIWECALKGRQRLNPEKLEKMIITWLKSGVSQRVVTGKKAA